MKFAALIIFFAMLVGGCGSASIPQIPDSDPVAGEVYGEAVFDEIEVLFLESYPLQVHVVASGSHPDGCTEVFSIHPTRLDNVFEVTVITKRPSGVDCTGAEKPFSLKIPLDVYGLAAGKYKVTVNNVEGEFEFTQDNVLEVEG